jgi:hypothetical protein
MVPYGPATRVTIQPLDPGTVTDYISKVAVHAAWFDEIIFRDERIEADPSGIEECVTLAALPPRLRAIAPNPLHGQAHVSYTLHQPGRVRLEIYDLQGRLVRRLIDRVQTPGRYEIVWDGCDDRALRVPSGVYYARLDDDAGVGRRTVVITR